MDRDYYREQDRADGIAPDLDDDDSGELPDWLERERMLAIRWDDDMVSIGPDPDQPDSA